MARPRIPYDDIKFYRYTETGSSLLIYKEHSIALMNANAFKIAMHIHPTVELLVVTRGEITLRIAGKEEEKITDGEAGLIFPFQPHEYSRTEGTEYFRFSFSTFLAKSFFKSVENKVGERSVFTPDPDYTLPFLEKLRKKEKPHVYKTKCFIYSMIADFLTEIPLLQRNEDDKIISRAISYMDENKREKLSLGDVASAIGYSEKYLSRCINRISGLSFTSLLYTLRLDEARTMLLETDKTMLEIAIECGFGSERTFYRQFKELTGASPNDYRKADNLPAKVHNDILV